MKIENTRRHAPGVQDEIEALRLVGKADRRRLTGVSDAAWAALEKRGRETGEKLVPERVQVLPGRTAWRLADLLEWVRTRPAYTGGKPPTRAAAKSARQVGA